MIQILWLCHPELKEKEKELILYFQGFNLLFSFPTMIREAPTQT